MAARLFNLLIGIWVIVSVWVMPHLSPAERNADLWTGVAIGIVAVLASTAPWVRLLNTLLGAWLIIAPFAIGYFDRGTTINDVCCGAAVLLLSLVPTVVEEPYVGRVPPGELPPHGLPPRARMP